MSLTAGMRLGPYEILGPLGSGGMGEVYRARDSKLNREVAIKVLPGQLARDPERLARFEREARVLASLNHPHIAHIHGFEDSTGISALVMEMVEGLTLADRISQGPLGVGESLQIAVQIADAIEAARERGIVHRDLKPANVKVTPSGDVRVLDFGLATAVAGDAPSPDVSLVTVERTEPGLILGTAAYMSPEQARGRPVDNRTDIWAFGCVLFEMLAGRRTFSGDTVSDTIATILTREPAWADLPAATPPEIRRLLRRCLHKDPRRRLRDIGDARLDLEDALSGATSDDPAGQQSSGITRRTAIGALAGALAGSAATGLFASSRYRGATPRRLTTFAIADLAGESFVASFGRRIAISPDGTHVAFVAASPTQLNRLYLRSLGGLEPRLLLESGAAPFFSPDSLWIASVDVATEQLRKIGLSGGAPVTVCRGLGGGGGVEPGPMGTPYILFRKTQGVFHVLPPLAGNSTKSPNSISPTANASTSFRAHVREGKRSFSPSRLWMPNLSMMPTSPSS